MNRAAVIGETLARIAQNVDSTDVELVILDSSPDDGTEKVLRSLEHRLPPLTYRRQPPAAAIRISPTSSLWLTENIAGA
ncbi:MAG: hypothetical protein J6386_09080 [Candidatus Synoicihabitans palmerolidicus]|nr:hypothetical protein [Candidatus Synoicihabitans palmerolidicus]